ncbi:putative NPP1 domain protein [Aspergillus cavernicola]|uniref:NPP1 domain protein n=1 Tax=Aspergillus cavernicola TaxID=176166 RepID=A0ABR4IFD9_9EURO
MTSRPLLFLASLAATAASIPLITPTNTTPLTPRDVIAHDAVVGFPETVPTGSIGDLYLAYQPYLEVINGCVPFPAVDADGNTSGGLEPTGSPSGGCSSSTGQIYARSTISDGTASTYGNAIMYSWYFPKDSPSTGLGHRHDWEGVIIWLSDSSSTSAENILAVCPSAHGDWNCETNASGGVSLEGSRALIRYYSVWPVNHQLGFSGDVGGVQPLVAWESLGEVVRGALEDTDFGDANVPFKEGNWVANLQGATY